MITSNIKSKGNGIRRSKRVSPLPLTHEQTAKCGQMGSVAKAALSRPLKAQLS